MKTVYIFGSQGNGWSELYYQDRSTLAAAKDAALAVAPVRNALLGTGCRLEAVRISTVDRPYKSTVFGVSLTPNSANEAADTSWNTVLGRIKDASDDFKRVVQLRGVPDNYITRTTAGEPTNPASNGLLLPQWDAFMNVLKGQQHRFKVRSTAGDAGTLTDAGTWLREADGRLSFAAVAVAVGPGGFVTFSDVTGPGASQFAKGRHKVKSNAAGRIITETIVPESVNPALWSPGKVRIYTAAYPIVERGELLRYSHRDTGRRFFVTRGRRPKRPASLSSSVV